MKLVSMLLLCLLILMVACNSAPPGPPRLPETASFGWKLSGISELKAGEAPEVVSSLGFAKSWRAEYTGPGRAHVDVYRLQSQAAGLEMTQRWRAKAQTVTVFNASYFVVISWEGADRAAATALVGQVERSLPHSD